MTSIYDFSCDALDGTQVDLKAYRGKILLIVNTASKCGFTPQLEGLEELYRTNKDRGLVVLGFPCNQFGSQEPGSNAEIGEFCQANYGVSFPMFAKVEVNGPGAAPLYRYLKKAARGVLWSQAIKWNFTKFLVGPDGQVVKRFAPTVEPKSLLPEIERLVGSVPAG
ncbi:MAG TPA: glutathione peroxidase [Planctomycetota bacterium]|nr:glutathione peroxidase [Planctomycetota bacterium]HRV80901.1 glutathione peroxidase [Planctomycetota bacterium]